MKQFDIKIYTIEKQDSSQYSSERYRFRSLYNSCIGSWQFKKKMQLNKV